MSDPCPLPPHQRIWLGDGTYLELRPAEWARHVAGLGPGRLRPFIPRPSPTARLPRLSGRTRGGEPQMVSAWRGKGVPESLYSGALARGRRSGDRGGAGGDRDAEGVPSREGAVPGVGPGEVRRRVGRSGFTRAGRGLKGAAAGAGRAGPGAGPRGSAPRALRSRAPCLSTCREGGAGGGCSCCTRSRSLSSSRGWAPQPLARSSPCPAAAPTLHLPSAGGRRVQPTPGPLFSHPRLLCGAGSGSQLRLLFGLLCWARTCSPPAQPRARGRCAWRSSRRPQPGAQRVAGGSGEVAGGGCGCCLDLLSWEQKRTLRGAWGPQPLDDWHE